MALNCDVVSYLVLHTEIIPSRQHAKLVVREEIKGLQQLFSTTLLNFMSMARIASWVNSLDRIQIVGCIAGQGLGWDTLARSFP